MALQYLDASRINQFLPVTKWQLTDDEADQESALEQTVKGIVLGQLARRFDVTTWLSGGTTPGQVLDLMAMHLAGRLFNRQFVDDATESTDYGNGLIADANTIIGMIVGETIDIIVEPDIDSDERIRPDYELPSFLDSDPIFEIDMVI